jgi:dTDP-4-amino-4,6-dideoxygalactose transaminase
MSAMLLNVGPGDEVIVPSYTFVSTALAFVRQGAHIVFCDSHENHPGMDEESIEALITERTKVIVVVHYGGVAANMDKIMSIAGRYTLMVVEDAAQGIDSYYRGKPLGSIGHLGCFSFHETKNIQAGEGGMLTINDEGFIERAEIIWEKGTNRSQFFRGEIDKYNWVDTGSSFLPSEIVAAFLFAQLERLEEIQEKRIMLWNQYYQELGPLEEAGFIKMAQIPDYGTNNGHLFYILCSSMEERTRLIMHLKEKGISAVFHYLSLHKSPYYKNKSGSIELIHSDRYSNCLLRLPLYYELTLKDVQRITHEINSFFSQ